MQAFCSSFIERNRTIYLYLQPLFLLQFQTGCRIGETLDLSRWSKSGSNWLLTTEKTGDVRTISGSVLDSTTKTYLTADQRDYPIDFYSRVRYAFGVIRPYLIEYNSGQDCRTHIFRHNYVRQKVAAGESIADIAKDLQVRDSTASHYANENLYRVSL